MKSLIYITVILLFSIFIACSSSSESDKKSVMPYGEATVVGTWTLVKEDKNGKIVNHSDKPTAIKLTLKENGYFILFDRITDEKIQSSGISAIQENYKGQYENDGKTLKMNQFIGDSVIIQSLIIKKISSDELVLSDSKIKLTQYFKKEVN